ncbi:MAG: dihydrolipoyl dehydrogenase [Deltaproteobacteria bacterium HGW-Deltaproteobacteria-21]|nr:MAG: dihydrolipoyl dehydrogenase [Deltaproteobacteria bacterium HGW-Deltaproteobacteria-21]
MVMGELTEQTELLVIGGGPGGYAAAFRAADLGMEVAMVDVESRPGGECLFRGCIPSKTLLYLADIIHNAERSENMGITFGKPRIDLQRVRSWKDEVINSMADGLVTLSKKRGVQLVKGRAVFEGSDVVRLRDSDIRRIKFKHAIIATGSRTQSLPEVSIARGGRVMDSDGALDLADIPERLLVIGGGYVALELGTVYASLGSRVTLAVRSDTLLRGADPDLVVPLSRRLIELFENIYMNTRARSLKETDNRVDVVLEGEVEEQNHTFDRVLVAVGRRPNSADLGLDTTKVKVNEKGYIVIDDRQRTSDEKIYAIGDVAGGPLLAHKAFREGKVAAEVIKGEPSAFDVQAMPAVVYTNPQIAWCGLTESQARQQKRNVRVERFPWKFSGRATSMGVQDGLTKLVIDPETQRILGVGIVGHDTEGLIAEGVLAVEMGAVASDVALSVHPHPTLTETLQEAADRFLGSSTHILPGKKGE